jgi:hypothetical protein
MTDFNPNYDGSHFFASMGEGSNAHKNELFEKAKKFLKERKEEKI